MDGMATGHVSDKIWCNPKVQAVCIHGRVSLKRSSTPQHPNLCLLNLFVCHSFSPLVEEADDLARDVLAAGLLVVHDTGRGGEDDIAELTGREKLNNPLLELAETDVVAGGDDTALVHAAGIVSKPTSSETWVCGMYSPAVELDNDLAAAVVVDLLELANVA
jgi:hypothetical protein